MTATGLPPYRSEMRPGHDGFAQQLRAEWTKTRTVRGWITGLLLTALLTVLLGVLTSIGGQMLCSNSPTGPTLSGAACRQVPPLGPDGEPVSDSFYFVHQTLSGNGTITARVTSLTGTYHSQGTAQVGSNAGLSSGTQPWTKAGIIIKQGTTQGSAYAAMTTTGSNGVRMQYDYTHDVAGLPGRVSATAPQWLRLTRSGETISGYDSTDGVHWTRIGTATLPGLPASVQAGMFTTSPVYSVTSSSFGGGSTGGAPTQATGTFDNLSLQGAWTPGTWTGTAIGGDGGPLGGNGPNAEQYYQSGGTYTVTGSGDIAPADNQQTGQPVESGLIGAFAGLIVLIVVAALFITAEYRRGLIRLTLAASPRRGRVLAAKAVVIGLVAFTIGLAAAAVTLPLTNHLAYSHGAYLLPASTATKARLVVGTAALFAVVAVFTLAMGTLLRRSAATVTLVIVVIVLPYILATASVLPAGVAQWLTRLTPAAGFAIQQTLVPYPQVTASYTPDNGYFPLGPWTGFAVLCAYAALALSLALYRLRRRDA
jgi:ABC-type transport system involved in multi-copper enzyme maturation permease subunit/regulation of enolase protein 1 (concanavalin A-like superfamily)